MSLESALEPVSTGSASIATRDALSRRSRAAPSTNDGMPVVKRSIFTVRAKRPPV